MFVQRIPCAKCPATCCIRICAEAVESALKYVPLGLARARDMIVSGRNASQDLDALGSAHSQFTCEGSDSQCFCGLVVCQARQGWTHLGVDDASAKVITSHECISYATFGVAVWRRRKNNNNKKKTENNAKSTTDKVNDGFIGIRGRCSPRSHGAVDWRRQGFCGASRAHRACVWPVE